MVRNGYLLNFLNPSIGMSYDVESPIGSIYLLNTTSRVSFADGSVQIQPEEHPENIRVEISERLLEPGRRLGVAKYRLSP